MISEFDEVHLDMLADAHATEINDKCMKKYPSKNFVEYHCHDLVSAFKAGYRKAKMG